MKGKGNEREKGKEKGKEREEGKERERVDTIPSTCRNVFPAQLRHTLMENESDLKQRLPAEFANRHH
jgi:hypothetical protein